MEEIKPCEIGYPKTGELFYAVIYQKNGLIDLRPEKTRDAADEAIKAIMEKYKEKILKTDVIKVNMSDFENGFMFSKRKEEANDGDKYDSLNKAELTRILKNRGIKVFYHDTIPILKEKCRNSEKGN